MTREQAIEVLKNRYYSGVTRSRTDDEWRLATDTAIAALREKQQRQPDPDTGLVPCGCGGKAVFDSAYGDDEVKSSYTAEVYCELCEIRTPIFRENADVKAAWNRAMGWRVEG